jgi:hypothetical protein
MRNLRFLLSCSLFFLIAIFVLSCGSSNPFQSTLKSINVTPATANGQALFTATGIYADGRKVSPLIALWSAGNPWVQSDSLIVTIVVDARSGWASCATIPGKFTVEATAPVDPRLPLSQMGASTPQVSGMAQLSCP